MVIQHNVSALNSYRQLGGNNNSMSKNLEKLSSGYRINRAGDDAAGLAISEKMRAQIKGLEASQKNSQDGISLVQTAEGALTEVHSMLNRMVELATQSSNGTSEDKVDRANLQEEVSALKEEINRIASATNFNGINLLDGTLENSTGAAIDVVSAQGNATNGSQDALKSKLKSQAVTANGLTAGDTGKASVTVRTSNGTKTYDVSYTSQADQKKDGAAIASAFGQVKELNDLFKISDGGDGTVTFEAKKAGDGANVLSMTLNTVDTVNDGSGVNNAIGFEKGMKLKQFTNVNNELTVDGKTYKFGAATNSKKNEWTESDMIADLKKRGYKLVDGNGKEVNTTNAAGGGIVVLTRNGNSAAGGGLNLQIGDTADTYNRLEVKVGNMSAAALGINDVNVGTEDGAAAAIKQIKDAINTVSKTRGNLGAVQNRLEHTINNLGVTSENMTAAEARIRDTDMAKEMMAYTKNNILIQASQAMLAQANQVPQGVLQLLQ